MRSVALEPLLARSTGHQQAAAALTLGGVTTGRGDLDRELVIQREAPSSDVVLALRRSASDDAGARTRKANS
jgi:hypothetical protein